MQHTLEHTGIAARICLFENICLCIYAHIITAHGNLGLQCRQTALSSRIRNKLHRGYALAMVTPPKRCCGSALSPWLPINPSNVVWFLQICSSLTTFRCWMGVLRTCSAVCFYFNCLNSQKQLLSTMEPLKFHSFPHAALVKMIFLLRTQLDCLEFAVHRWISEKIALVLMLWMLSLTHVWALTRPHILEYITS